MINLSRIADLGGGRPYPSKLGRKRARTDKATATKPEDVVGPDALTNPRAAT